MKATKRKAGAVTRRVTNLRMYGEIIGRRMGLTIQSGNISTGCTDGNTVIINFAAFSDDPDAIVLLDGTCTHEFGHVRYTEFLAKRPILSRPLALSFYRALEDGRMEACEKRDYPGMALRIEAALEVMVKKGLFCMPRDDEPVEDLFPNMLLGWVRGHYLQQKILEPMYKARLAMLCNTVGMPLVKGFLDIARDGLERARTTLDVVKCSIALEEYLQREQQSMEAQQQSQSDDPSGSKEQDQGKQESDDETQSDSGSPQGEQEDDTGNQASQGGSQDQNDESDDGDPSGSKEQDQGKQESGNSSSGNQQDAGDTGSGTDSAVPSASGSGSGDNDSDLDQAIRALSQLLGANDLPETDLGSLLQEAIDKVAPQDGAHEIREKRSLPNAAALQEYARLSRQIELKVASHLEVLLESRLEERSHLECSGRKLSSRHLANIKASPSPRVFRIDEDITGVSTAVSVLLDVSASMEAALLDGVSRLHAAVASARAAVSSMDKHEVPCSLHFFGEYLTPVKHFDEPWRRVRDLHWRDTERNTLTGHAVERVVPDLAMRDEERKLLLLVTDGFPAEPDRTAAALQTCESFGVETAILLINSGGGHESVYLERFTKLLDTFGLSWIEVNSTDQLADGLMQAIRDAI